MIGTTIDQYKILSRIGGGGMGEVYRALDLELQRDVAIKCVRPEIADLDEVTKRFRNEARTLAKLSHPNIATVYRFFTNEERLFLVMEYIDGKQFSGIAADGNMLGYQDAISMIRDALHGLGYAHENGVVHRDIKPGNLMLDQRGMVKVLDFGIAHLIGGTRLTRAGSMVGTPAYMAPEQILGKQVDQRTDLYSLGIVLYELLSGKLPFQGDSEFELMRSHLEKAPPQLREVTSLEIPLKLQQTVERALGKEKEERFQSALEFDAALADVVVSEGAKTNEGGGSNARSYARSNEGRDRTTVLPVPTQGMADLMRPVATEIKRRMRPQQIATGAAVAALLLVGVWAALSPSTPDPTPPLTASPGGTNQGQFPGSTAMGGQPPTGTGLDNSSLPDPSMIGIGLSSGQPGTPPVGPVTLADGTVINPAPGALNTAPPMNVSTVPTSQTASQTARQTAPQTQSSRPPRQTSPTQPRAEAAPSQPARVQPSSTASSGGSSRINVLKVSVHEKQGKGRFSRDAGYNGAFTLAVGPNGDRNVTVEEVVEVLRDGVLVKREVVHTATRTPGTFKSKQRIPQMKSLDVGTYDVRLLLVNNGRTLGSYKWRVDVVD